MVRLRMKVVCVRAGARASCTKAWQNFCFFNQVKNMNSQKQTTSSVHRRQRSGLISATCARARVTAGERCDHVHRQSARGTHAWHDSSIFFCLLTTAISGFIRGYCCLRVPSPTNPPGPTTPTGSEGCTGWKWGRFICILSACCCTSCDGRRCQDRTVTPSRSTPPRSTMTVPAPLCYEG